MASTRINLLLEGYEGLSMLGDAEKEIASVLGTTQDIYTHPNFLRVARRPEKKSIGVDELEPIFILSREVSARCECNVVLIDGIDILTVEAQNKLLKLIEDCSNLFFVLISYGKGEVLPTIRSRCSCKTYSPLSEKAFCSLGELQNYTAEQAKLLYCMCGGCPGLVSEFSPELERFSLLEKHFLSPSERYLMLSDLSLVKEKDKDAVTTNLNLMLCTTRVLLRSLKKFYVFQSATHVALLRALVSAENQMIKSSYTKDDFFFLILNCIELE